MRLTELCPDYKGAIDPEIKGLTQDSRKVVPGWLFAALPGSKTDGRLYIDQAVAKGAVAVLAQPGVSVPSGVALVAQEDILCAFSKMAARFYARQPQTIVAVTGTNGKTSTVNFTQQIWRALGYKAASLGTLGVRGEGVERYGAMTTPDTVTLHETLADISGAGVTHLAMEASSHGLHQHRLDGVDIKAAAFTNITRDHLDYHADMNDYYEAKARLFSGLLPEGGGAILNADIEEYESLEEICSARGLRVIGYGRHERAFLRIAKRTPLPTGQEVTVEIDRQAHSFVLPLVGAFQLMNVLCAAGLALATCPGRENEIIGALAHLQGVPGRLQRVPEAHPAGAAIYVDYAHTPDALQNVLEALRPHTQGKLVALIGCGGDRDPGKRPVMARIAADLSDLVVITDDNPRTEDPEKIRAAMKVGAPEAKEIGGRRAAIAWAVSQLRAGDVLVLAGKGHEQGQIIGDKVEPFDDLDEAVKAIKAIKGVAA